MVRADRVVRKDRRFLQPYSYFLRFDKFARVLAIIHSSSVGMT